MTRLYSNDKTQEIDQLAAKALGIDSYALMQRAGAAIYQHLKSCKKMLVITGPGNNGGDGFVVAELARQNGQQVLLLALRPPEQLCGDARLAAADYQGEVLVETDFSQLNAADYDYIVDAIFGTGLNQPVRGIYAKAIDWINEQSIPVIAVDIPSGLNGSSGKIEGTAVKAKKTVAILARNTGLFTLDGKDCCGDIRFEDLGVAAADLSSVEVTARLLPASALQQLPAQRSNNSHKGQFGHVMTVGGQAGMMGAVLLAGRAVMKAGAGSTTLVTDPGHADLLPLNAPELMTYGFDGSACRDGLHELLSIKPTQVMLLGMGLGQSQWSKQLFKAAVKAEVPLVVDADGLVLLSQAATTPKHLAVVTPHPKEAASMLNSSIADIQADRWAAVKALAVQYDCVAVLKGSGTLISDGQHSHCCPYGNANLATAGSGDVLAGLVAGLMAQGYAAIEAAKLAVTWHAVAGEQSPYGMSMTATDLLATLHQVLR